MTALKIDLQDFAIGLTWKSEPYDSAHYRDATTAARLATALQRPKRFQRCKDALFDVQAACRCGVARHAAINCAHFARAATR